MKTFVKTLAASVLALAAASLAAPGTAPASAAAPDLLFFVRDVADGLNARCASCHSDPESAGAYHLEPFDDVAKPQSSRVLANFEATLPFLDPAEPNQSALLRKSIGGDSHGGGAVWAESSREYTTLLQFALGATLANRPPEAILPPRLDVVVGATASLDGGLSGDPDGDRLEFSWRVAERPAGSRAALAPGTRQAQFTPDRPGVYRLELIVRDGKLRGLPASTIVVAAPAPRPETPATDGKPAVSFLDRDLDAGQLRLVRRLFFDLKWRSPRLDEIEACYARPHEKNVRAFLRDEETWEAWYEQQLYYFLLLDRFRPKEGALTELPALLARGEMGARTALREIISSQYFNARNPGNDTYVTVVLEQCLGVVAQERKGKLLLDAGKKMYDGYRTKLFGEKGDSQSDFVRIVCNQPAFYSHLLSRTWKALHGAEIDPRRLATDAARFEREAGAFREILAEWLNGPEYRKAATQARTKPEIPYVRALYVDALHRTPTYEELRNVRNAFLSLADPTPIRLVMGRVLLESQQARAPASALDPARFVREQFVRLLGRPATAGEMRTFVAALRDDPATTPQVVLWTLLSSAEYQTY